MQCNVCLEFKDDIEFNFRNTSKGIRQRYCKLCDSVRRKSAYNNHRQKTINAVSIRNKIRWDKFKNWKSTLCCEICGENAVECLDFHHLDPSKKEFAISRYATTGRLKLEAEIAKCKVLCSNCHRKVHSGRIQLCSRMPPGFEPGES